LWLARALQLDGRNAYPSALEARAELDEMLAKCEYIAAPSALQRFLDTLTHPEPRVKAASPVAPAHARVHAPSIASQVESFDPFASLAFFPPASAAAVSLPHSDGRPARRDEDED